MPKIIAAAFLALLLASCGKTEPAGIPAHLREIMEASRAIALPPFPHDFRERADAFLAQGLRREEDARISDGNKRIRLSPDQHFREMRPRDYPADSVSRDDAAKDIAFLFDLMKYGYAGYQYFGGDEAFLPIRDSMLERLAEMASPMTGIALLEQILAPELMPIIADNHFQLHDMPFGAPPSSVRMNDDFILRRGRGGFVTIIDSIEYRLVEAALDDGQKIDGVIPTLTREGEAAFAFGHFARWDSWNDYEMSALLENANTGERLSIAIRLRALSDFEGEEILFDEFELNGVPVVVNRTLAPELRLGEAGARMRESGAALRGKSAIVFDLRGHSGGVLDPMLDWVRALTGKRPLGRAFASFGLASRTNGGFVGGDPIWTESVFSTASTQPLPNESLIVVLMDNYIASAGELLVGRLRELENVIFVGANTMGVLLTADLKRTALPLSGIHVIYGAELNLRPDFSQFEGVGFMPDLWVPPDQSLERVLAFIERYGLLRAAQ